MKKLLLCLTFLATVGGLAYSAGVAPVPMASDGSAIIDALYGGADMSTAAFTTTSQLIKINDPAGKYFSEIVVFGVTFSSGAGGEFVTFRDSDTANTSSAIAFRLYNSSSSTDNATTGSSRRPAFPAVFKNGVSWTPSTDVLNSVTVFFKKK